MCFKVRRKQKKTLLLEVLKCPQNTKSSTMLEVLNSLMMSTRSETRSDAVQHGTSGKMLSVLNSLQKGNGKIKDSAFRGLNSMSLQSQSQSVMLKGPQTATKPRD